MELSSELISQFARITNDEPTINEGSTVYATYRLQGESAYVQIDGSDTITPVATTAGAKSGDRVTVLIKDHKAIVTGNLTDPSASKSVVDEIGSNLDLGLSGLNDTVRNLKSDVSGINSDIETIGNDINGISSTVSGLNNTIQSVSNDVSDLNDGINNLKTDVNLKYTDINGNIQTLSGELETISGQVTGMVASIEGAAKVATNFIEFVDPYGLIIGDLTGSTLGFNTLIDATSLNMRYNDIVLAKYTANTIYLGYTSAVSEIVMCGGAGTIAAQNDASEFDADSLMLSSNNLILKTGSTVIQKIKMTRTGITLSSGSNSIVIDPYTNSGGVEVNGNLTVTGTLNATISGYAKESHTHSQYYTSGDNIYANKLYIQGAGNISGDPNARLAASSPNQLGYASGSSRKFKHDIKPIENAELDPKHLYDIEVVQFKYNDDYLEENDQRYGIDCIGFIAEQVNEVYPIAADRETGEPRNWEMRYIIPPMLALVQQQKKKIDELESRINELESKGVA